MAPHLLFAWIGMTDLRAAADKLGGELGPIGQAVVARDYEIIQLVSDHAKKIETSYVKWLREHTGASVKVHHASLTSPTSFPEIYEASIAAIEKNQRNKRGQGKSLLTYHISPGTPAMAAIWMILAKTTHPAELIESSPQAGVKTVSLPFDIAAEYLPGITQQADHELLALTQGLPPAAPEFEAIVHQCGVMKTLVAQARRVACHEVPVLILGESGTGKELLARAIHTSSLRKTGSFIAINCGAIPRELVESEFFGHEKNAFTGANQARAGHLEEANGGTLFLDEIGEMPLDAQVKLLRALQEGAVQRVGSSKLRKIDIRVIAATNRDIHSMVVSGEFRDDLFHRIAVGVLKIPPLRERKGDVSLITDRLMSQINRQFQVQPGWKDKKLSSGARNLVSQGSWPGNVRELMNTLSRAAIWSAGETIRQTDLEAALFPITRPKESGEDILNRSLGNDLSLQGLLSEVAEHYLSRALRETRGNKTAAAKLVGLPNYQTLTNWLDKYKVTL